MGKQNLPSEVTPKSQVYGDLKGADFSVDPSLVYKKRSPDLLNMISDQGGNPVKRKGWEVQDETHTEEINNIWTFIIYGKRRFVVAIGDKLQEFIPGTGFVGKPYTVEGTSGKRAGFFMQTASSVGFYILNQSEVTQATCGKDDEFLAFSPLPAFVPTVLIAREPNGGGTVLENINLLTRERKEQFINTANNKGFVVSSTVDTTKPYTARYKDANGNWANTTCTVSGATFTLPQVYYPPPVTGEDNIQIQYYATGEDKSDRIKKCQSVTHYNQSTVDRVFITSNPDFQQYVYYSGLGNPAYFPDLNYLFVGGSGSAIQGFLDIGEYLAVIKEQSDQDSTIYLLYPTTVNNETQYAVKQGIAGIGAVSKHCFGTLSDEPLFLSQNGVFGMVSTAVTNEKVLRNRSFYIDKRLVDEPNLENAVSTTWNNYYMIFINGHVYIMDGRHKSSDNQGNTDYLYESYYWDNVPATCVLSFNKELWFGTADGKICRFKTSGELEDYSDNGEPIRAVWSTPNDNFGATQYFKTMLKKGSMCTVAPYEKSSVKVYIEVDSNEPVYLGMALVDIWKGFSDIDFSRFAFDTRTGPRDLFLKKKQKKFKRMKTILENDVLNEPFGVHEIVIVYVMTRFAK